MEIKEVKTTRGVLKYYRDWEQSGNIAMVNPQTIQDYMESTKQYPDTTKYGVFFAFNEKQFDEGYNRLVEQGFIKDGDKVEHYGIGLYGTKEGINEYFLFFEDKDKWVRKFCDPQEVYFYEYNNYECMSHNDGDYDAIRVIERIWGEKVASEIVRIDAFMEV